MDRPTCGTAGCSSSIQHLTYPRTESQTAASLSRRLGIKASLTLRRFIHHGLGVVGAHLYELRGWHTASPGLAFRGT